MGPRLGRVEYRICNQKHCIRCRCFNGATLRTRGIQIIREGTLSVEIASMGPRLGRVEYIAAVIKAVGRDDASMGPRLGRVEYQVAQPPAPSSNDASMGPRLGRVEYGNVKFARARTARLQWGHA